MGPSTPDRHRQAEQPTFPEITPEDLAVAYITEHGTCYQIDREGYLVQNGRRLDCKYAGIMDRNRYLELGRLVDSRQMSPDKFPDALIKETVRISFALIQFYLSQGVIITSTHPKDPKWPMTYTSKVERAEVANALPGAGAPGRTEDQVRGKAERVLEEPQQRSKEAQIYALLKPTIQKAVASGKFSKLQAAAIAKKLGFPEAIALLLKPAISIQKAAETAIGLIGKQQQALLGNQKVLEDIASILLTRKEPELRTYLGIQEAVPPLLKRHGEIELRTYLGIQGAVLPLETYLWRAIDLSKTDLYEAIEVYREAATHYKDLRLYIRLACCLYESGELREAMDWVEKAKKLPGYDPEFLPEYLRRGKGFYGYNNYDRHNSAETFSTKEGLQRQQKYIDRGNAFFQAKDYAKAAAEYRKVLKLNPRLQYIPQEYRSVYLNLGLSLYHLGDYQGALEQLYELIRLYDRDGAPSAHYNAGVILVETGNIDAAIPEYREAVLQDPKYVDAYRNLGNLLVFQGRVEEALLCFQEIKKIKPDFQNIDQLITDCQAKIKTREEKPVEDPERVKELQETEVGQRALALADRLKVLLEKLKAELPPLEGQAKFKFTQFDEMLEVGNISKAFPEGGYIAKSKNRTPYGGWDYTVGSCSAMVFGGDYDVVRYARIVHSEDCPKLLSETHKKYLLLKFLYYLLIKDPKKLFRSGEHQDITHVCIESSWMLGPSHSGSLLRKNGEPNLNMISEYIVEKFREGGISFREMSSLSNTLEGKSGDRITAGDILFWVIDRLEKAWDATGGKLLG